VAKEIFYKRFFVLKCMGNIARLEKFDVELLSENFREARPFSHIVIDNFLEENFFERLRKAVGKLEFEEKFSDLFFFSQTKDLDSMENEVIKEFYEFISSRKFLEFTENITLLGNFSFVDMAATLYARGNYLLPHDDTVENRKLAYMLYLEDFKAGEGAELALYDSLERSPVDIKKTIFPKRNRLVIFEVGNKDVVSFHEVIEVIKDKKRFTIGGWIG